jgi:hypothetical protein
MEEIIDLLLFNLSKKGLSPAEIPRFVEDVLNIVGEGGDFTTRTINRKLETLGWTKAIIDQFILELIFTILENEGEYEVRRITIH